MKKTFIILIIISFISLFFNLHKKNVSPPGFSADEAAFGYNAYSLLKTGRDEYGTFMPLRLKSFGDYKMPLYSYLSIPFIAFGGLNETTTRALNTFLSILFPFIIFALAKQLFKKDRYGVVAALLFSLTPAIQTIGRQAHEAYLTVFLICLSLWLFLKSLSIQQPIYKISFILSLFLLSYGYQFSRLWLMFFLFLTVFYTIKRKFSFKYLLTCLIFILFLFIPDIVIKPTRVGSLLFLNNIGLGLQTAELRNEGGRRFLYNKLTVGLKDSIYKYFTHYSPQFLVSQGDDNRRFNYPGISPITISEYLLIFIGLYYLFKDKQKFRHLLLICLIISPIASSLAWIDISVARSLPLIVFISIISAYGFIRIKNKLFLAVIVIIYSIFCFYSWDFYFNHYPKRAAAIRSWQYGNWRMVNFVKNNYDKYDHFYITKKNGQPYIFLLFYLNYSPEKYQKQAKLSPPDEFGFGQVERFDKFIFQFQFNPSAQKTVFIGYPDDFNQTLIDQNKIKKIKIGTEEIFWIYENP